MRLQNKDCQQITDINGNVINPFPPQNLLTISTSGTNFLPNTPGTPVPIVTLQFPGCNPEQRCCGKIEIHPIGFFGGMPSAVFHPDLDSSNTPLYLVPDYFNQTLGQWAEITGYSVSWYYLGPNGTYPITAPISTEWHTGCIKDPGIYMVRIGDGCGNFVSATYTIPANTIPQPSFAGGDFEPTNNTLQQPYYNTAGVFLHSDDPPRIYVLPRLTQNGPAIQ
ncbi:MAG: hypothetical protein RMM53_10465, partial [Bacteroidia bacterium]|nr:hypothetical protein [Bacteroidia bacterium]